MRVNPQVLKWARERLYRTVDEASSVAGLGVEQLTSWEEGTSQPTFQQAVALARKLRVPFGYLFLSELPSRQLPLPDLRTAQNARREQPSANLIEVVNDAVRKQHWYSDLCHEERRSKLSFVGSFNLSSPVEKIAASIREWIGINEQFRAESAPTTSAFLTQLVRRSEEIGILVLRSGTVCGNTHRPLNPLEFRGFALADDYAPVVFINTRDAMAAQIFTWAHEIAHIWLAASGVSLLDFKKRTNEQAVHVETICNSVAAETLVPTASFLHTWNASQHLNTNLVLLRRRYRVSELVVLRKAYDLNLISESDFFSSLRVHYEVPLAKKLSKEEESEGGGNYYLSLYARNSSRFTAQVTESLASGNLLTTDACTLLGVKRAVLNRLTAVP